MDKYCEHCGEKLNENQVVCLNCGAFVNQPKEEKSVLGIKPGPIDPLVMILLIIFCFPLAIIYYLIKKDSL